MGTRIPSRPQRLKRALFGQQAIPSYMEGH
jgi:hypothetical protein